MCLFLGPIMLREIIRSLESPSHTLGRGLLYVAVLTVAALVQSFALRQYFFKCYRTGMHLRSAVVTTVFEKSLRMSSSARAK